MSRSSDSPGRLDELRVRNGPDALRAFFRDLRAQNPARPCGCSTTPRCDSRRCMRCAASLREPDLARSRTDETSGRFA